MKPRFEEHEGKLIFMLDEPVPLTTDAKFPCLVRLIQDDSPMGRLNKRNYDETLNAIECVNGYNKMLKLRFYNMIFAIEKFEIIGYPVAEGSKEWALHQMMQGKAVTFFDQPNRILKLINGYIQDSISSGFWNGRSGNEFLSYASSPGWQIYEEPKPLLAEAKVGDLCQRKDGMWVQIDEIDMEFKSLPPSYRCGAGWWTQKGASVDNQTLDIIHWEPLAPKGTKEWALQMMKLGKCVCHVKAPSIKYHRPTHYVKRVVRENCTDDMSDAVWMKGADPTGWQLYEPKPKPESENIIHGHIPADMRPEYFHLCKFKVGDWVEWCGDQYMVESAPPQSGSRYDIRSPYDELGCSVYPENITRKLSPSEIVVRIGCLSGTITKSCDPNCFLMIHSRPMTDCDYSIIRFSAIDKETRELVEDLLKAQEEK